MELQRHREAIAEVCRELNVTRLDSFGSAARRQDSATSDVDVLVRFDRSSGKMFTRFFELKERLEDIFGRPVDIVIEDTIKNPYLRESINRDRMSLYET